MANKGEKNRAAYGYIILYIILVLLLSWVIKLGILDNHFQKIFGNTFLQSSDYLIPGISTLVAGSVGLLIHKGLSDRITIFGDQALKNVLILCLPIFAFSICGLNNKFGMNIWLYGFLYAIVNTIYAFAEEFGWRRYFQNSLEPLNKNLKYILIGIIWWIWHFRFNSKFDFYIFPFICIGGGFLLGKLADDFKSILPTVSMHTLIILTTNAGNFGKHEIIGISIVVMGWIIIEQIWKRKKAYNRIDSSA